MTIDSHANKEFRVRKVVAYELLSLDGVAEQPDEFITDFDDVMRDNLDRVIATQDAVLLGWDPLESTCRHASLSIL